jgi:hypothetical protein
MRKLVAQEDLVALDILPRGGKLRPAQMLGDKLGDGAGRRAREELWRRPEIWSAVVGMRWSVDYLYLLLPPTHDLLLI